MPLGTNMWSPRGATDMQDELAKFAEAYLKVEFKTLASRIEQAVQNQTEQLLEAISQLDGSSRKHMSHCSEQLLEAIGETTSNGVLPNISETTEMDFIAARLTGIRHTETLESLGEFANVVTEESSTQLSDFAIAPADDVNVDQASPSCPSPLLPPLVYAHNTTSQSDATSKQRVRTSYMVKRLSRKENTRRMSVSASISDAGQFASSAPTNLPQGTLRPASTNSSRELFVSGPETTKEYIPQEEDGKNTEMPTRRSAVSQRRGDERLPYTSMPNDDEDSGDGETVEPGSMRSLSMLQAGEERKVSLLRNPSSKVGIESASSSFLVMLVQSHEFDLCAAVLVILYALFLGIQTNYIAEHWPSGGDEQVERTMAVSDNIFVLLFIVELALRLYAGGWDFFCGHASQWNLFDSVIVLSAGAEPLVEFCFQGSGNANTHVTGILRTIRIVRLVRTLRLVRMLYLIAELHTVLRSIVLALRSLFWTVMLMLIFMYMVAICMTQLALECNNDSFRQHLFGSIPVTMMTLYAVITNGLSWSDMIPDLEGSSPLLTPMLLFFITLMLFGLMNVIASLLVKSVMETTESCKRETLMSELYELFKSADVENCGTITATTFCDALGDARMEAYLRDIDCSPDDAVELFSFLDLHGDGEIAMEEFLTGIIRLHGNARAITLETFINEYRKQRTEFSKFMFLFETSVRQIELDVKDVGTALTIMAGQTAKRASPSTRRSRLSRATSR